MFWKRIALPTALCALTLFQIFSLTPAFAATPATVRLLSEHGSVKVLRGETVINAPVEAVWKTLTNYNNLKNVMPGYDRTVVLQSADETKTLDIGMKASPLTPAFRYQIRVREEKPAYLLRLNRVSGDFRAIEASYKLVSLDDSHTQMIYTLNIDLGNFPSLGAGQVLKGNTEKGLNAMQAYCSRAYQRSLAANAAH